jgi:hypothetical protein
MFIVSSKNFRGFDIAVVKKAFRYSNGFFYNQTSAYTSISFFGTYLWKAV